ncbi:MAG TPA: hypothetical protein VHG72_22830 [Polyangia bacterium]|nr:hypothetical protein [Polyangia bacterium]
MPSINGVAAAPLTLGGQTASASYRLFLSYIEEVVISARRDKSLERRNG